MTSASSFNYQVGGSLPADAPSYIERQCDRDYYELLKERKYCYVFNCRQMGKSSLRVRVTHKLQAEGGVCATIDPQKIGVEVTCDQWYSSAIRSLVGDLDLKSKFDLRSWIRERELLSPVQRFAEFIETVVLQEIDTPIVIFVEEIDRLLSLKFGMDDFFGLVRSFFEDRPTKPDYNRLTFSFLGVATPTDLIQSHNTSAFNIGYAVEMTGFTLTEALPLMQGLASKVANPQDYLEEAVKWTGGQPFLIQRLLGLMEKELAGIATPENIAVWVENLVQERIVTNWESQDTPPHLTTIRDRVISVEEKLRGRMLGCYQQVLADGELEDDRCEERSKLRLTGLVVRRDGRLRSYNPIYAAVFNNFWVERQLASLRPAFYIEAFTGWQEAEIGKNEDFLLRGQALEDAEVWARGKRLNDQDEQFLRESREIEKQETAQKLDVERQARASAERLYADAVYELAAIDSELAAIDVYIPTIPVTVDLPPVTLTRQEYRDRQILIDKVRNFWIQGVLKTSLHGRALLELGLEERQDALEYPWQMDWATPEMARQSLPTGSTAISQFDRLGAGRTLLILGEPGAGKTTMLLEIARNLLERADSNPNLPIPIVFNLSSWQQKQSLAIWLVDELSSKYQVPKKLGKVMVDDHRFLLLLDGLDEVDASRREACVEAINGYHRENGQTEIVVCSRIMDYEALSQRLQFQGAIFVSSLNDSQVHDYLEMFGEELAGLMDVLPTDERLQELARSPLMLSVMSLAYRGINTTELIRLSLEGNHVEHLFSTYVDRMLTRRKSKLYQPERVKHFLGYLAQQMVRESQTIFLIESIQPEWLRNVWLKRINSLALGLVIGLPIAETFNRMVSPIFVHILHYQLGNESYSFSLVEELIFLSSIVIFVASITFFLDKHIKTSNVFSFSWVSSLQGGIKTFIFLVCTYKIFDLSILIILDIIWNNSFYYSVLFKNGQNDISWWSYFFGSWNYWGYNVLKLFALAAIISGISDGFNRVRINLKKVEFLPNQGIWNSVTNYLYCFYLSLISYVLLLPEGLISYFGISLYNFELAILTGGGIFAIFAHRSLNPKLKLRLYTLSWISLICFIVTPILYGMVFSFFRYDVSIRAYISQGLVYLVLPVSVLLIEGGNWFKHLILRVMIFCCKQVPWNYARFLDYATNLALLQKIGGGYVFIHRTLLEHFARNFNP